MSRRSRPTIPFQAPTSTSRAAAAAVVALTWSNALTRESAVAAGAVSRALHVSACSTLGAGENWPFAALLAALVGAFAYDPRSPAHTTLEARSRSPDAVRPPSQSDPRADFSVLPALALSACPQGAARALSDEPRLSRFLLTTLSEHGASSWKREGASTRTELAPRLASQRNSL